MHTTNYYWYISSSSSPPESSSSASSCLRAAAAAVVQHECGMGFSKAREEIRWQQQPPLQQRYHRRQWRTGGAGLNVFWLVLLLVAVFLCCGGGVGVDGNAAVSPKDGLCGLPECVCAKKAGTWMVVNCTLFDYQDLELGPITTTTTHFIPDNVMELFIAGGNLVTVDADTFTGLRGFNLLRLDGAKRLLMRSQSFHELTTNSVLVQLNHCDRVVLERAAFKNKETSVVIEMKDCKHVSLQTATFSRLQEGTFTDIGELELHEGAFTFENMKTHGRHGPVTNLSFQNVAIPKIPRAAFSSALAELNLHSCQIGEIDYEAFKAKEISSIAVTNSTINRLHRMALIDGIHIVNFHVEKSTIRTIETNAIMAAFTKFNIQHSRLIDVQPDAINTAVAVTVHLTDNHIQSLSHNSLTFRHWNYIQITDNIILHLHSNFLNLNQTSAISSSSSSSSSSALSPTADDDDLLHQVIFKSNEIYQTDPQALSFLSDLTAITKPQLDGNFFNVTCHCDIHAWLETLVWGDEGDIDSLLNSSFCTVDKLLSHCFELPEGLINMRNFTELVCGPTNYIQCEPYHGENKVLNTTLLVLLQNHEDSSNNSSFVLYLTLWSVFVVAIVATVIILTVRFLLCLKRRGYFPRNSNDDEEEDDGDVETGNVPQQQHDLETVAGDSLAKNCELELELTPELLAELREKLADPATHDEARDLIEKLYETFIVDDTCTNNNRHEDEAHLYEELGNLQSKTSQQSDLLKLMMTTVVVVGEEELPRLANEYSEPSDAQLFHVYSELKQGAAAVNHASSEGDIVEDCNRGGDTVKSSHSGGSGKMAFRPLPAKPEVGDGCSRPGPSTQYKF